MKKILIMLTLTFAIISLLCSISFAASPTPTPTPGVFNYAVFSNNALSLCASQIDITGNIHSNTTLLMSASKIQVKGTCESVGSLGTYGSTINITKKVSPSKVITMPDLSYKLKALATNNVKTTDILLNDNTISPTTPVYTTCGNITVSGNKFIGRGSLVTEKGNIIFGVSSLSQDVTDVCLYAQNGDITLSSSVGYFNGIIYAPNGTVTISNSKCVINGKVIAKSINISSSTITITDNNKSIDNYIQPTGHDFVITKMTTSGTKVIIDGFFYNYDLKVWNVWLYWIKVTAYDSTGKEQIIKIPNPALRGVKLPKGTITDSKQWIIDIGKNNLDFSKYTYKYKLMPVIDIQ